MKVKKKTNHLGMLQILLNKINERKKKHVLKQ